MKLGDVAEIIMGQSPKGKTYNTEGIGVPLLNGPTEFGPSHPDPASWTTAPTKICEQGNLLFCVRGSTTGRMNWADQPYCLGRGVAAFRAKSSNREDTRFIYYQFQLRLPNLLAIASGSVFPNLSAKDFQGFEIDWPDKRERFTIAHLLGLLDDRIDFNRQMNETLEAMARALFKSWFVDFDPTRAKTEGRQPAHMDADTVALFPDALDDEGKPMGWRHGSIADLADLNKRAVKPQECPDEEFDHYSIPAFDMERFPLIDRGEAIKSNKTLISANAVLLSKLNPDIRRVWWPVGNQGRRPICSTEFLVLTPYESVPRSYIYSLFSSDDFAVRYEGLVTGTSKSHQRVKPDALLAIEVVVPSSDIMASFNEVAAPLFAKVVANQHENRTLAKFRDTLLPKLMSGEIRVRDADREKEVAE